MDGARARRARDDRRARQRLDVEARRRRAHGRADRARALGERGGPPSRRAAPKEAAEDVEGYFVHPVRDAPVMAGNGTIGLELVEQLDEFDAVLIPWGGGGLTTGSRERAARASRRRRRSTSASRRPARRYGGARERRCAGRRSSSPRRSSTAPGRAASAGVWEHAHPLVTDAFPISLEDTASDGAAPARAGAHRRRRRRGAPGRRRARGSRGRGSGRLHRLRREHRQPPG